MQLVIVESPTKAKTITKFLSKDYKIESSFGHIRDLPEKELGIDIEKYFEPKYVVPAKAKPKVKILKDEAKKAKEIILATDSDREGEAIAWHLAYVLGLKKPQRIVFHEITKSAIEKALKNPQDINDKLVNAQQARRILDRLVGYKLSPFLWKKAMRGLSAGRVQSVAVRLICDRENEIANFKPEEFWSIKAVLGKILNPKSEILNKSKIQNSNFLNNEFKANLIAKDGKTIDKLGIKNKAEADKILNDLKKAEYKVADIETKETKRNPQAPFTTSSLQQTAANKLGFTAKRTMMAAQRLYENGFITYHRTDSLNLSAIAQQEARNFICNQLGKNYWPGFSRNFQTKSKGAQEAHEAIRPTYPAENLPEKIKSKLSPEMFKIYDLVWRRFVASQMTPALFDATTVDIGAKHPAARPGQEYTFRVNGQVMKFDGFLKICPSKFEETDLPQLEKNEILELKDLLKEQHFTQPPARYSEATLIKVLEKEGIGRPSTYAPILDTIQNRNYVEKDENKKFIPTKIGAVVNGLLVEHFPKIVDVCFTAQMEQEFDEIAAGKETWQKTLGDFYFPFEKILKEKEKSVVKIDLTEKTDRICPQCGGSIIIRLGRFGKFYACSKFPNCKFTENIKKPPLNVPCPKCGSELVEKNTKKRKIFYGCSKWPDCDFAVWDKPTGEKCENCGSLIVQTIRKQTRCSNKECLKKSKVKSQKSK